MDTTLLWKIKNLSNSYLGHQRLSTDEYFLSLAILVSLRGTCQRRRTGAILVNKKHQVISTGYNGNPSGTTHCIDIPCEGVNHPSGSALDKCEAIHAEVNAIVHCLNPHEIHKAYLTTSPCVHCVNALLATPCKEIVFLDEYPHSMSKFRWEKAGRIWTPYIKK